MNNVVSISNARANLQELIRKVNKAMGRVVITVNGKPKAVVLSADELEVLEETAEIMTIPGAKNSIAKGLKQAKQDKGISLSDLK